MRGRYDTVYTKQAVRQRVDLIPEALRCEPTLETEADTYFLVELVVVAH